MWGNNTGRLIIILLSVMLLGGALWISGPTDVLRDLQQFPVWVVASILGIFMLNLIVVSFRLARILGHFGINLPPGVISRASVSGHLAGLLIISIFGQVVGRHLALRRFGVSPVLIATLTAYERVFLVLVGGGMCFGGALVLINQAATFQFLADISLIEIALTAMGGIAFSLWLGRSSFEWWLVSRAYTRENIVNFLEVGTITLLGQMLVLASFVVGVLAVAPQVSLLEVVAAAAIISFAASIPVTINGWGVRELAAVYTLSHLGVSSSSALAVSILVGLCSTSVILMAAPVALKNTSPTVPKSHVTLLPHPIQQGGLSKSDIEKIAVWIIALVAAALIFFQAHIGLPSGIINLNLADPFAIISLAAAVGHCIASRQFPEWRVPGFNWMLVIISALIAVAFAHGVQEIGVTQWALVGRLMGWLVLLGYLSIGYLLVSLVGTHGLRRFAETMIATAALIVVLQASLRILDYMGWGSGYHITSNFEGYSGNRNAFAFQLLMCSAMLLAYSSFHARVDRLSSAAATVGGSMWRYLAMWTGREGLFSLLHGIVLLGIYYTGSLGGLIAGSVLLVASWVFKLADRRMICTSLVLALLLWWLPYLINWLSVQYDGGFQGGLIGTHLSGDSSHDLRWETITNGLELWWSSPIFGAGLGIFFERSIEWIGRPVVIHSTPVWILAEFGLFGAAVFAWILFLIIRFLHSSGMPLPAHRIIALSLLAFLTFSLVHEIFYQRVFWLVLGVALAVFVPSARALSTLPKSVFHIITGLDAGGAERMLTRLVGSPAQVGIRHSVVSLMDEGVFGQEIRAKGTALYTLKMRRGLPAPVGLWRLVHLLRTEKPDIVMTWLYHADLLGLAAGWLAGIKQRYWNLRCSDMTQANRSPIYRLLMWLLVRLSPFPSMVITNSESGKRHHQHLGYRPKKWQVLPNGVDLGRFLPKPEAGEALRTEISVPENAVLIGHIARFHPMKDYPTLLESAARVIRDSPLVHYVLVGRDVTPDNPYFANQIEHGDLAGRVHLLGSRNDIPEILAGLDMLALSSAYGEGSPNVVIEAMACAVPCVVTDVGDAARIVGDTGRVVQPRDPGALATATLELLGMSDTERQSLKQKALARIQQHYDMRSVARQYRALFLEEV